MFHEVKASNLIQCESAQIILKHGLKSKRDTLIIMVLLIKWLTVEREFAQIDLPNQSNEIFQEFVQYGIKYQQEATLHSPSYPSGSNPRLTSYPNYHSRVAQRMDFVLALNWANHCPEQSPP